MLTTDYFRNESITAPRYRLNELGSLYVVAQHGAQIMDVVLEDSFADGSVGPDGPQQCGFGDQTARMVHQVAQDGKGFGAQRHDLRPAPQTLIDAIELIRAEAQDALHLH